MRGVDQTMIKDAILGRLKLEDQACVHYLSYGQHTATNAFKGCKRVLLMGLNFLPRPVSMAASGAALDMSPVDQLPSDIQVQTMRVGMLMDSTLQALLRGNARMGVGGDCGDMEAVIPQTKQTGISLADYRRMFPGVRIVDDRVLMPPKPLTGRLGDLAGVVSRRLEAGEREMTNPSLYAELGMDQRNFSKLVKRPEWRAYISQLGLNPQKLACGMVGLVLVG